MLGTSLLWRSTVAFTYLKVKSAKYNYFRWSWSCLGLVILVLFTSLVFTHQAYSLHLIYMSRMTHTYAINLQFLLRWTGLIYVVYVMYSMDVSAIWRVWFDNKTADMPTDCRLLHARMWSPVQTTVHSAHYISVPFYTASVSASTSCEECRCILTFLLPI